MADKKISALTASTTPLAGTEVLPIVQGGSTVKVSVANLTAGRAVAASSLTTTAASAIGTTADENVGFLIVDATNKSYAITARGNDQSNARVRIKNTGAGGEDYAFVAGQNNVGNVGLSLFKIGVGTSLLLDDGSGNFNVSGGNVIIGTAGKGIDFSANTHAAGMTSELLNDYEEGTWTPTIQGLTTGGTTTYTTQSGKYTRIGRQITCTGVVEWSAATGTGSMVVGGLPVNATSVGASATIGYATLGATNVTSIAGLVVGAANYFNLYKYAAGASANITVENTGLLYFSITYFVG